MIVLSFVNYIKIAKNVDYNLNDQFENKNFSQFQIKINMIENSTMIQRFIRQSIYMLISLEFRIRTSEFF